MTNFQLPLDTLIIITTGWKKQRKTVKYAYYCSYYLRNAFNLAAIHTWSSCVKLLLLLLLPLHLLPPPPPPPSFSSPSSSSSLSTPPPCCCFMCVCVTAKACPACYPTDMISIAVKVCSWPFPSVQVWSGNSTPFHNVACTCQDSLFHLSLFTYLLTYSMEHSPWEAYQSSTSQKIPCIL